MLVVPRPASKLRLDRTKHVEVRPPFRLRSKGSWIPSPERSESRNARRRVSGGLNDRTSGTRGIGRLLEEVAPIRVLASGGRCNDNSPSPEASLSDKCSPEFGSYDRFS